MPSYGKTSKQRLATCHPLLQLVMNRVIETYDCTIVCGFRGEVEQNKAHDDGKSQLFWPDSKHNNMFEDKPYSLAVDVAPYQEAINGIPWKDIGEFRHLAGRILVTAEMMGIKLIWGGNWKSKDYPHYELDKSMLD